MHDPLGVSICVIKKSYYIIKLVPYINKYTQCIAMHGLGLTFLFLNVLLIVYSPIFTKEK